MSDTFALISFFGSVGVALLLHIMLDAISILRVLRRINQSLETTMRGSGGRRGGL